MQEKQANQQKQSYSNPNLPQALHVDAYDLVGLLEQVQAAVLQGYKIDLSTNETYPVQLGTRYCLTMTQEAPEAPEALEGVVEQDSTLGSPAVKEALVEAPAGLTEGSGEVKGKPGRKKQG